MIQKILHFITDLLGRIFFFLPDDPFGPFVAEYSIVPPDWLHYLNWLIPVGDMVAIADAWLTCIVAFYAWQALLRWAKAIN